MKIGLVGYQRSGKSTLFHWLTGVAPDPAKARDSQTAMAPIPEPRVAELCEIYVPKKITQASLEIVDTPGLERSHEGSAARLAAIREALRSSLSTPLESLMPTTKVCRFGISSAAIAATKLESSPPEQKEPTWISLSAKRRFLTELMKRLRIRSQVCPTSVRMWC